MNDPYLFGHLFKTHEVLRLSRPAEVELVLKSREHPQVTLDYVLSLLQLLHVLLR